MYHTCTYVHIYVYVKRTSSFLGRILSFFFWLYLIWFPTIWTAFIRCGPACFCRDLFFFCFQSIETMFLFQDNLSPNILSSRAREKVSSFDNSLDFFFCSKQRQNSCVFPSCENQTERERERDRER